jgi:hypothetical protein
MKAHSLVSWSLTQLKYGILTFQLLLITGAGHPLSQTLTPFVGSTGILPVHGQARATVLTYKVWGND